jgi:hypothetical protein
MMVVMMAVMVGAVVSRRGSRREDSGEEQKRKDLFHVVVSLRIGARSGRRQSKWGEIRPFIWLR